MCVWVLWEGGDSRLRYAKGRGGGGSAGGILSVVGERGVEGGRGEADSIDSMGSTDSIEDTDPEARDGDGEEDRGPEEEEEDGNITPASVAIDLAVNACRPVRTNIKHQGGVKPARTHP